jgi:urea transport system permease protein
MLFKTLATKIYSRCLVVLLTGLLFSVTSHYSLAENHYESPNINRLANLLSALSSAKFKQSAVLIKEAEGFVKNANDPQMAEVLTGFFAAYLDGKLYFNKSDKRLLILEEVDGEFSLQDPFNNEMLGVANKQQIKKIRVNNRLRKTLRKSIARLTLFHPRSEVRLSAVDQLMQKLSDENVSLLKEAQESEKSKSVREKIDVALALFALSHADPAIRKQAAATLAGNMEPAVKAKLDAMLRVNEQGKYLEPSTAVRLEAQSALASIDLKRSIYGFVETVFFGLSLGSVLLLVAIGLSITFGVMGVINMAHGELIMLGAYTTYVLQSLMPNHIGLAVLLSIPAAFIVSGLVGVAIERGVIQFLKGRPLETLLATFGISLILQQTVRTIFSPLNRQVITPEWMSGALQINPVLSLTYNRLYVILFSLIVFTLLLLIMKRTVLGLYVRAVSQNRDMAKAMGIRSEWVDAMTFGLGSGVAGLAGVALSQLTNVGPNLGQAYIIDSFMVVVFGGVGNLWGTLVGGLSLGVANKFLEPVTGAVLAKIIVLVALILFIQKRPSGLFPQKGRSVE